MYMLGGGNASDFRKKLRFGEEDSANISMAMKPPLPHLGGLLGAGGRGSLEAGQGPSPLPGLGPSASGPPSRPPPSQRPPASQSGQEQGRFPH